MFVRRIRIENLKLLRRVSLSFEDAGQARPWTVLIGENGTGKTTLLQAIAMGVSGPTRAMQLADVASLPDSRRRDAEARITTDLEVGGPLDGPEGTVQPPGYRKVRGQLTLRAGSQRITGQSRWIGGVGDPAPVDETEDVIDDAQTATNSAWFVVGYGVHRELNGKSSSERRRQIVFDRLAPLFGSDAPILGPAFAEQMLSNEIARAYGRTLAKILQNSGIIPGIADLDLRARGDIRSTSTLLEGNRVIQWIGHDQVALPAQWLSQGYQATLAWLADLVGQAMLHAGRDLESEEIEGLVLIDELDLFLHPTWQTQLVSALRATFPKVQFVATTHSPLVLSGLRPGEAHVLEMSESGDVTVRAPSENPQIRTGGELYADFFGIDALGPTDIARALRRFGFIANNPFRNDAEDAEMHTLLTQLKGKGVEVGFDPQSRLRVDTSGQ